MSDFSVILPAKNEAKLLPAALASIAAQSYPLDQIEAIVASNGSRDGTIEVAAAIGGDFAANGGPVVRVVRTHQSGISLAKNLGAGAAAGRWIVFMDADSRMSPELLATVAARASAGEGAARCRCRSTPSTASGPAGAMRRSLRSIRSTRSRIGSRNRGATDATGRAMVTILQTRSGVRKRHTAAGCVGRS